MGSKAVIGVEERCLCVVTERIMVQPEWGESCQDMGLFGR